MRTGAMILGILSGLFSLGYVGLFGGLFGSFVSAIDRTGQGATYGHLIQAASIGLPLLALSGAVVSGRKPMSGGVAMMASALGHLVLLRFGTLAFVFGLPIGLAGLLAILAEPQPTSDRAN